MTLRQFFLLIIWGGVGAMFYMTNLPGFIKWTIIFLCVLIGVAFAFLPLEGRPLDKWLVAFIKSIYSPTRFLWKKNPAIPDYLQKTTTTKKLLPPPPIVVPRSSELPNIEGDLDVRIEKIDESEKNKINQINSLFESTQITPIKVVESKPVLPQPTNNSPLNTTISVKTQEFDLKKIVPTQPKPNITPAQKNSPQPLASHKTIETPPPPAKTVTATTFNPNLPFPTLPETPNTLVGMVFDQTGNIIENAVIEIKNNHGTVRATKTNRLGQFFLATPLASDSYTIETERTGLTFKPISLKLEGKIYPPIELRAIN